MNFTKWTASTLTALLIASAPAFAGDHDKHDKDMHHSGHHSEMSRYDFEVAPGNVMIFKDPVSFTGEVIAASNSHRTIRAANGMTIIIPNQAMVWNGDTQMFGQATEIGDEVVIHMRSEEPYRLMGPAPVSRTLMSPAIVTETTTTRTPVLQPGATQTQTVVTTTQPVVTQTSLSQPMMAVGSYDGVFYFSEAFIADLDLDNLDNNIYAEYDRDSEDRIYDIDLTSVDNNLDN